MKAPAAELIHQKLLYKNIKKIYCCLQEENPTFDKALFR